MKNHAHKGQAGPALSDVVGEEMVEEGAVEGAEEGVVEEGVVEEGVVGKETAGEAGLLDDAAIPVFATY